ncbi:MAG: hypothetical protein PWR01_3523 [Clostridiales bacterium]|jgi:LysM repeat protein|nr:hypothetical protein [Clostridiales bacterium]MDN5282450.1 hypothetical protein [Candidatus Ozemobacter sp.]
MNKKILVTLMMAFCVVSGWQLFAVTTHTFKSGDTLWELAAKHYGDPTLYPVLLQVNGIDNPRTIPNGKVIIIPDKADMQNIAKEKDPAKKKRLIEQATGGSSSSSSGSEDQNSKPAGKDAVSRSGEPVDPEDTSFTNILQGPKVSPDKLIQIETP